MPSTMLTDPPAPTLPVAWSPLQIPRTNWCGEQMMSTSAPSTATVRSDVATMFSGSLEPGRYLHKGGGGIRGEVRGISAAVAIIPTQAPLLPPSRYTPCSHLGFSCVSLMISVRLRPCGRTDKRRMLTHAKHGYLSGDRLMAI